MYCYEYFRGTNKPVSVLIIEDLDLKKQYLKYYRELEMGKEPYLHNDIPLKGIPQYTPVYVLEYTEDSLLAKVVSYYDRGAKFGGSFTKGWVYAKTLHKEEVINKEENNYLSDSLLFQKWNDATIKALKIKSPIIDAVTEYREKTSQQLVTYYGSNPSLRRDYISYLKKVLKTTSSNYFILEYEEEGEVFSATNFLFYKKLDGKYRIGVSVLENGKWKTVIEKEIKANDVVEDLLKSIKNNLLENPSCVTEENFILTSFNQGEITSYPMLYACSGYLDMLNNKLLK